MIGLMQRQPLLTSMALRHAAGHHRGAEIVSRLDDGSLHRTNYAAVEVRARRLARVLQELGVRQGDRVATLAMNGHRHLELYYAITGIGAIYNTINPRLARDDIAYIVNHAEDRVLFADAGFAPLLAGIAPRIASVTQEIVLLAAPAEMPPLELPAGMRLHAYEALLAAAEPIPMWPDLDENGACGLCYTSGTTGRPKGVLYSHRSTILHAMMMTMADTAALRAVDRAMPVVPMFHVNAWGLPFAAPMAGTSLVLPGRQLDPASLIELLDAERVTISGGVPTVWLGVIGKLREERGRLTTLERIMSGDRRTPPKMVRAPGAFGRRDPAARRHRQAAQDRAARTVRRGAERSTRTQ
ncbi:MAG TPA: AMP-binding protein [Steroidobacteraceae bacterium]|nr:AMP-binding protein [Steroidobacteraceae bacterium]